MPNLRNVILASLLAIAGVAGVLSALAALMPLLLTAPVLSGTLLVALSGAALAWLLQRDRMGLHRREHRRERLREQHSVHHL